MDWLFERIIELAAWAAFILAVIFLCDAVWMLVLWVQDYETEAGAVNLTLSCNSAIKFIGAALALGTLAVIDRYVFDVDEA